MHKRERLSSKKEAYSVLETLPEPIFLVRLSTEIGRADGERRKELGLCLCRSLLAMGGCRLPR